MWKTKTKKQKKPTHIPHLRGSWWKKNGGENKKIKKRPANCNSSQGV